MAHSTSPCWRLLLWSSDLGSAPAALALVQLCHGGGWPRGPTLLPLLLVLPLVGLGVVVAGPKAGLWTGVLRSAAVVAASCLLAVAALHLCGLGSAWAWGDAALAASLAATLVTLTRSALWLATRHHGNRRCILVGRADCRRRLRDHLAAHPASGLTVVAEVGEGMGDPLGLIRTYPLGELEDAVTACEADEVVISTGLDERLVVLEAMTRLLHRPLHIRYVPDSEALPLFFPRPADVAGLPAIDLSRGPLSPQAEFAKWIEDKAVALVAVATFGLPMLVIAAIIKATSPGPALFVQERHGQYGRPIRVFKFRTMRAEHCTRDVTTGTFRQAGKGDMRVTAFGRFLRNTSLDELPQFLNVLAGDMSVVGPRPHPIALNRRFAADIGELMRRHYVKPGITGLAQISGARGETRTVEDMRLRVAYDLEYLRRWSLWLDIGIIARTLVAGWVNQQP